MPRRLERRLFISYFVVFSVLLLAFALAIHLSFVASLKSQMAARLDALLLAGVRSVHIGGSHMAVRENFSPTALLAAGQGLQWFDARGNAIASEGLVPAENHFDGSTEAVYHVGSTRLLRTRTRVILNPETGMIVGWVRAAQDVAQTGAEAWRLDEILIIGALATLAASALGGRYLQIRSVQPIRTSYERLQEFSADASHELRGPITAVNSNADAALRDASGMRAADRERFASISQAAKQMARLTDDLLLIAGADRSIEHETFVVDLSVLIERLVRLYDAEAQQRGVHVFDRVSSGLTVYGNPDQIERVFANLLENALRYTPRGGRVEIQGGQHRGVIAVRVRDSGIGIHPDHMDKIFDRFWRAQTARTRSGGTGLGLPIARALARRHGGDVTASSQDGHGSEFSVTFPSRPPT